MLRRRFMSLGYRMKTKFPKQVSCYQYSRVIRLHHLQEGFDFAYTSKKQECSLSAVGTI